VTKQVYKIPDSFMCNLQFHISYIHILTWKNVDPNYVHVHIIEYNSTLYLIVYMTGCFSITHYLNILLIVNIYVPF
jgi:hypothetical protein